MAFDATEPKTTTKVKDSPAKFQANWEALEDTIAEEHLGNIGITPGQHRAGKCAVCHVGTADSITALGTVPPCAIAYNTTLSAAQYKDGTWKTMAFDHSLLSKLASGDPHPQYIAAECGTTNLILDGRSIVCSSTETVDGVDISVHASGMAGAQHAGGLGTIFSSPVSNSVSTVYQATTDGILVAQVYEPSSPNYGTLMSVVSDENNPPTTVRASCIVEYTPTAYMEYASVTVPILKNHYYKVTHQALGMSESGNEVFTIYFYPVGS
jgi:hypothetical protein